MGRIEANIAHESWLFGFWPCLGQGQFRYPTMSRTKSWSFRIHSPRGALVSRRFVTSRENQRTQLTKHTKALSESNSGGLLAQISSKVILIFPIFRSKAMFYSTIWCRMLLKSVLHLMTEPE